MGQKKFHAGGKRAISTARRGRERLALLSSIRIRDISHGATRKQHLHTSYQFRVPAPSADRRFFEAQALASAFPRFHPPANDYERHLEAPGMNIMAPMQLIRSTQLSLANTLSGRIQAHEQAIKGSASAKKNTYWFATWLNKKEKASSISTAATRTVQAIGISPANFPVNKKDQSSLQVRREERQLQ